jgi:putative heme-binding domain-containing protein
MGELTSLMGSNELALEAVAALPGQAALDAVAALVANADAPAPLREAALVRMGKRLFSEWSEYRGQSNVTAAIEAGLKTPALQKSAVELADDLDASRFGASLAAIARDAKAPEELRVLAIQATGKAGAENVAMLDGLFRGGPMPIRIAALRGLGLARPAGLDANLQRIVLSKETNELRSEALRILARTERGANLILDLEQKQQLPPEMRNLAANMVASVRAPAVQARAAKILPPPATRNKTQLPPARFLAARQGNAAAGKVVFSLKTGSDCASCHSLDPNKQLVGPNLSAIGSKLGKEALLDSILNPSAGIAHEYVTWILDTRAQGQVVGIVAEDTPQRVVVKTDTGESVRLRPADITARRKSNLSMMPEDLVTKMTEQQLVDLLEYLATLKDDRRAAR